MRAAISSLEPNSSSDRPTATRSPKRSRRICTTVPLTRVPLVLSRSVRMKSSLSSWILAWNRLTPFVVETQQVAFLAADGDRQGQFAEYPALVDAFQDLKGNRLTLVAIRLLPRNDGTMDKPGHRRNLSNLRSAVTSPLLILGCQSFHVNSDVAGRQPGRWRNQVICRLANCRVRICTRSIASCRVHSPSRWAKTSV